MPSTPTVSRWPQRRSVRPPPVPRARTSTLGRPGVSSRCSLSSPFSRAHASTNPAISPSPAPPATSKGLTESMATSETTSSARSEVIPGITSLRDGSVSFGPGVVTVPVVGGAEVVFAVEPADSPTSLELQQRFFAEIASRYPGWEPGRSASAEPSDLAPPTGTWIVAYLAGRPVGCGGLKGVDRETAEIRRIFLDASARGRGIGGALLTELEAQAERLGYRRVRLTTGDRQPEALRLFRSAGYVEVAPF